MRDLIELQDAYNRMVNDLKVLDAKYFETEEEKYFDRSCELSLEILEMEKRFPWLKKTKYFTKDKI